MDILIAALLIILIILVVILLLRRGESAGIAREVGEIMSGSRRELGEMQSRELNGISREMKVLNDSVSRRLEQVYKSIGEIHSLNSDVYELKKILSNVKTRGILGEMQLKGILSELLAPSQYAENCRPIPRSRNVVEFAVKLPGNGTPVYLPIDSKFPGTLYHNLCDAYDSGDTDDIDECAKALTAQLMREAADIRSKYIEPPYTTDFAIMFLPFEGLYMEAVNRGMVELLLRRYNVAVAGPSSMAALLNALMIGFNTLAVEQKASEVWEVLSGVRTEFEKFSDVLEAARKHTDMLARDLEKLETTRTNAIMKKLDRLKNE